METTEIKITLTREPSAEGRFRVGCDYDANILKDLVFAAISDEYIGKAAEFAVAYLMSRSDDPEAYLDRIRKMSEDYITNKTLNQ